MIRDIRQACAPWMRRVGRSRKSLEIWRLKKQKKLVSREQHLQALLYWQCPWISVSHAFLICKMGMIPSSQSYCEDQRISWTKACFTADAERMIVIFIPNVSALQFYLKHLALVFSEGWCDREPSLSTALVLLYFLNFSQRSYVMSMITWPVRIFWFSFKNKSNRSSLYH